MSKHSHVLQTKEPKEATQKTRETNGRAFSLLPFGNQDDFQATLTRDTLDQINTGAMSFEKAVESGALQIEGKKQVVTELFGLLGTFEPLFAIVTP